MSGGWNKKCPFLLSFRVILRLHRVLSKWNIPSATIKDYKNPTLSRWLQIDLGVSFVKTQIFPITMHFVVWIRIRNEGIRNSCFLKSKRSLVPVSDIFHIIWMFQKCLEIISRRIGGTNCGDFYKLNSAFSKTCPLHNTGLFVFIFFHWKYLFLQLKTDEFEVYRRMTQWNRKDRKWRHYSKSSHFPKKWTWRTILLYCFELFMIQNDFFFKFSQENIIRKINWLLCQKKNMKKTVESKVKRRIY